MTVPLDRLYHFVKTMAESVSGNSVIIYRFYPHGQKNIENLNPLDHCGWFERTAYLQIYCHDQEPLNFGYYAKHLKDLDGAWCQLEQSIRPTPIKNLNFNARLSMFEKTLLLISEKNSADLTSYKGCNMIPVYYWNHAFLARDWFRYAQHEQFEKTTKQTFLIYNRAWSGSREYRLGLLDRLIDAGLVLHCRTSFNPIDPESRQHYTNHDFMNTSWIPKNCLEDFVEPTQADSNSSADFVTEDYNATDIELVLETLFDDQRIYLTEKTLRPIACGQPFVLASTPGALSYLRDYGFKTFENVWDEKYDEISDPVDRMQAIIAIMQQIASWDASTRTVKLAQARLIAQHNRQWFFSQEFWHQISEELRSNLENAFGELYRCDNYTDWIDHWSILLQKESVIEFLDSNTNDYEPTRPTVELCMQLAKQKLSAKA